MINISLETLDKMKEITKIYDSILQINLKNIENNYNYLKRTAPNTIIAACVKANAYGLGSAEISKALYKQNCRNFFVATLEEALLLRKKYKNVNIIGLMGMATFTSDKTQIESEFKELYTLFSKFDKIKVLSIGMSGDYKIAIESGSTMIRIGSTIFGNRKYISKT